MLLSTDALARPGEVAPSALDQLMDKTLTAAYYTLEYNSNLAAVCSGEEEVYKPWVDLDDTTVLRLAGFVPNTRPGRDTKRAARKTQRPLP